jgi:hypothetical protein
MFGIHSIKCTIIIPLIQSADKHDRHLLPISDINETLIKLIVWIRGRGRQYYFIIRHRSETIQAVISVNEIVSKSMIKFIAK